ncbi:GAF domain-containing protein [Streptomyces sp. NPDC002764]|uniref:GAF domain-containing protein n=1 Tax=Streptomyces sp. NPDC002764 TaxID=3154428 RepID=UPI00332DE94E
MFDQLGTDTAVVAPLRARRQVLGAVTVGRSAGRAPLTSSDLAMVDDLAHRMGLGVDNARLHRETQHTPNASSVPCDHPRRRHPLSDRWPGPPPRRRPR